MKWLLKTEEALCKILEIIISGFFVIILLVTIAMVILRYVFNSGIYGGNELISYLFVYTTALGAAASLSRDEHIKITVLVALFPRKAQKYLEALDYLLVGFLNFILILLSFSWIRKVGSFESPTLRIPNAWVQFGVPLGCAMAVIFCVFRIIQTLREAHDVPSSD